MSNIDYLSELITTHHRRLKKLEQQCALYGSSVDPRIPLEIEDIKAELEKFNIELISKKLHDALLRLNYHDEELKFRQVIDEAKTGAFVIHGSPRCGQRWLLNRLFHELPNSTSSKVIEIGLRRLGYAVDIDAIWRELGRRARLPSSSSSSEVVDRINEWWRTQNVVLIFNDIAHLQPEYFYELVNRIWRPLTELTQDNTIDYRLLMFMIDESNKVSDWEINYAEEVGSNWRPYMPIELHVTDCFSFDTLITWLRHESKIFSVKTIREIQQTVQMILKDSENGTPELVLFEICRLIDYDWFEGEQIWMKL